MGIFKKLFRRGVSNSGVATPDQLAKALIAYGQMSASGIRINPASAMRYHAVRAAVSVLTETMAQLPLNVYLQEPDGDLEIQRDHWLQKLISSRGKPNGWQSSFELREWGTRNMALVGNAYFIKNMVRGQLRELIPMPARYVEVIQNENFTINYRCRAYDGQMQEFTQNQIFHLRCGGDLSYAGDNVIAMQADSIGLAIAQEHFASFMFERGIMNSGVLKHPAKLSDAAYQRLKASLEEQTGGLENAHKPMVLEEGMEWTQVQQTLEQTQLLDSRKFARTITAAIWRIPPHMIGDLEKATFSNIENLALQFIKFTMMPWIKRWESAMELQLLSDAERLAGYCVKFNVDGLLRGDSAARAAFYTALTNVGAINPNEIRAREDMNSYEGGDQYTRPLNTTPIDDETAEGNQPPGEEDPDESGGNENDNENDNANESD